MPYEEMPAARDPECGYLITANNRIAPRRCPPHLERLPRRLPRAADRGADRRRPPSTTSTASRRCRPTTSRSPALETVHRLARLTPRDQREVAAIERLKSWDGRLGARLDRRLDLPGVHDALRARGGARARSATATSPSAGSTARVSGFTNHVTSPWRWHSHLLRLWEEGDDELIGALVGRARARRAARRARRPRRPLRPRPRRLALGPDPPARLPARVRGRQPALRSPLQPQPRGRRRPGDGEPDRATTPTTPTRRSGRRAGAWSPTRPIPTARAGSSSPASRASPASPPLRRPPGGAGWRGAPSR